MHCRLDRALRHRCHLRAVTRVLGNSSVATGAHASASDAPGPCHCRSAILCHAASVRAGRCGLEDDQPFSSEAPQPHESRCVRARLIHVSTGYQLCFQGLCLTLHFGRPATAGCTSRCRRLSSDVRRHNRGIAPWRDRRALRRSVRSACRGSSNVAPEMRGPLIRRRLHAARQVCCGPLRSGLTDEINPFSVRFCARYRLRCRANPSHGPARSDLRRHGLHPGVPHRLDHSDDQVPVPRPDHQRAPGGARDHSPQHDGHGSDEAGWRFELADPPGAGEPT